MSNWTNKDTARDLLLGYEELEANLARLEMTGVTIDFLDTTRETIIDAILDLIGIPQTDANFNRDWYYFEVPNFTSEEYDAEDYLDGLVKAYEEALKDESQP